MNILDFLFGWTRKDTSPKRDEFPPDIAKQCALYKQWAVNRWTNFYGVTPRIPFVRVTWERTPYQGAAWANGAHDVRIARDHPVYNLLHEFMHCLDAYNGKPPREYWE